MSAAIAESLQRHPAQQALAIAKRTASLALAFHKTCKKVRLARFHMWSSKSQRRSDRMG
ncbi:MAG: hypothetical protein WCJ04_07670 [Actinomycetes bacterium]